MSALGTVRVRRRPDWLIHFWFILAGVNLFRVVAEAVVGDWSEALDASALFGLNAYIAVLLNDLRKARP